eukprot:gnl/MRDRNA2_/MRDRNA2_103074_c0_seq1.p1 gnl/MRDRNA2_/MRDRNA2_103074_c0~~gnl/MRDRNA2_/MRDRNA2_103074_c0_seq1.p1  ORF type:complete len:308 (-),score=73.03 gnl/MRDRNA2_/MRDRNA2_103074_c0_seq1:86-1009(-)
MKGQLLFAWLLPTSALVSKHMEESLPAGLGGGGRGGSHIAGLGGGPPGGFGGGHYQRPGGPLPSAGLSGMFGKGGLFGGGPKPEERDPISGWTSEQVEYKHRLEDEARQRWQNEGGNAGAGGFAGKFGGLFGGNMGGGGHGGDDGLMGMGGYGMVQPPGRSSRRESVPAAAQSAIGDNFWPAGMGYNSDTGDSGAAPPLAQEMSTDSGAETQFSMGAGQAEEEMPNGIPEVHFGDDAGAAGEQPSIQDMYPHPEEIPVDRSEWLDKLKKPAEGFERLRPPGQDEIDKWKNAPKPENPLSKVMDKVLR